MKRSRVPTLHHDSAREPLRKSRATAKTPPCETQQIGVWAQMHNVQMHNVQMHNV